MAYRKEITRLRSQQLDWDQLKLVQQCVRDAGFPCARDCAAKGWRNLRKAVLKPAPAAPEVEQDQAPPGDDDVDHQDQHSSGREIQDSQEGEDEPQMPIEGDRDAPLVITQL